MNINVVFILVIVLLSFCTLLFTFAVFIKIIQGIRKKKRDNETKKIKSILNKLFSEEAEDFHKSHKQGFYDLSGKLAGKKAFQTLEDVLLSFMETAEDEVKKRARTIAYYFMFPDNCLSMIRDRLPGNVAIGCRKVGLYQYDGAIPDILKALDILSGETQLQALMALSRIGDSSAMIEAFDKINRFIFLNERVIREILSAFTGDPLELYKNMIHHESEYLVCLFLKSIDKKTANTLIDDIALIFSEGGKETRLASIIAIGKSGNSEKISTLIYALEDKEWEIRAMAVKTLGTITDPAAITLIKKAARDSEWWVRQNAIASILSYPDHEDILISIAETGDSYAYDSMLYTLQKADKTEILSKIKTIWDNRFSKDSALISAMTEEKASPLTPFTVTSGSESTSDIRYADQKRSMSDEQKNTGPTG